MRVQNCGSDCKVEKKLINSIQNQNLLKNVEFDNDSLSPCQKQLPPAGERGHAVLRELLGQLQRGVLGPLGGRVRWVRQDLHRPQELVASAAASRWEEKRSVVRK